MIIKHKPIMLNEKTRYGYCPGCDTKHYSFFAKPKPTKKDPNRVEWVCMKRKTRSGKRILAVRQTERSFQQRRADRLWSKAVLSRGQCQMAGVEIPCSQQLHPHHIFGRSNFSLRFDLRNGLCTCAVHHRFVHDNPALFTRWMDNKFPGLIEELNAIRVENKGEKVDYDEVIRALS